MNDNNLNSRCDGVPVRVNRVFDSCSDKDCMTNLKVTITDGTLPSGINIVRSRAATVDNVYVSVEPVPFNKGFYSIDLTFTFNLEILGYENSRSTPITLNGTAYATKNCILYGSESSVRTFTSDDNIAEAPVDIESRNTNLPTAYVSVLEPIVLETKIGTVYCGNEIQDPENPRSIFVTLGLFSVVELTRPVTIMVPTLDYTIPKKECCVDSESPCEVFDRLKFPEEEFSPLSICNNNTDCDCIDDKMS